MALRESGEGEYGYDAEVVAAAEGEVEVWVRGVVYVGDAAIGEDDPWVLRLRGCGDRGRGKGREVAMAILLTS